MEIDKLYIRHQIQPVASGTDNRENGGKFQLYLHKLPLVHISTKAMSLTVCLSVCVCVCSDIKLGAATLADIDIHAVTGGLKMYFRELPEPLFTEECYQSFIDTLSE